MMSNDWSIDLPEVEGQGEIGLEGQTANIKYKLTVWQHVRSPSLLTAECSIEIVYPSSSIVVDLLNQAGNKLKLKLFDDVSLEAETNSKRSNTNTYLLHVAITNEVWTQIQQRSRK